MKRKLILILTIMGPAGFGQNLTQSYLDQMRKTADSLPAKINKLCDSVCQYTDDFITSENFIRYTDKYFSDLVYDKGTLPTGTSASLELADKETTVDLSLAYKTPTLATTGLFKNNELIITGGASGKVDNGISEFFKGLSTTSGTSFFLDLALLRTSKTKHSTTVIDRLHTRTNMDTLKDNKVYLMNELICGKEFEYKLECLKEKISCLEIYSECPSCLDLQQIQALELYLKQSPIAGKSADSIISELAKRFDEELYKLELGSSTLQRFTMFWVTGGATYKRETYDTYNESLPVMDRFDNFDFNSWSFRVSVNKFTEYYRCNLPSSIYYNFGYSSIRSSNYSTMNADDIFTNILHTNSPDTVVYFQTNKKAKNITNKDFAPYWEHRFSGAFTATLWQKKDIGVNLQAISIISPQYAPQYTAHIGTIFRVRNNKYSPKDEKEKSIVNFEFFLNSEISMMQKIRVKGHGHDE